MPIAKAVKAKRNPPRHLGFYLAALLGLAAGAATFFIAGPFALNVGACTFFGLYVAITLFQAPRLNAAYLRAHAAEEDAPAGVIFLVMIGVVVVSVTWLILALIGGARADGVAIGLGALSVFLGWFAVHTMWAMHYAYEYYDRPDPGLGKPGKGSEGEVVGGLSFPGGEDPDATAFLYFAYVIGMTAQTSDTDITTNQMRRIVTAHSVFSFFFNTIIVAAVVNIVVSLGR